MSLTFEDHYAEYENLLGQISWEPPQGDRYQQRFFSRFEQEDPENPLSCWLWTRSKANGYGWFNAPLAGKSNLAHRYSYALMRAEIPDGLHIDHLCKVKHCVNPWHLEPVTQRENNLRADSWARKAEKFARRTHCKHGHELTPETTVKGTRKCKTCKSQQYRAWVQRQKEARA